MPADQANPLIIKGEKEKKNENFLTLQKIPIGMYCNTFFGMLERTFKWAVSLFLF